MRPDSAASPAPWSPLPPSVRRRGPLLLGFLALCAVLVALVYGPPLAQGALISPQSVTYTPPHGPASPILLDSRPEAIIQQYLADYLRLAGTYPCEQNPNPYYESSDPFLGTGSCALVHPVASVTISSVIIHAGGLTHLSSAYVSVRVEYQDGSHWQEQIELGAFQSQGPWPFATHLTCWQSVGTAAMFGQLTPDVPSGAQYFVGNASPPVARCKP